VDKLINASFHVIRGISSFAEELRDSQQGLQVLPLIIPLKILLLKYSAPSFRVKNCVSRPVSICVLQMVSEFAAFISVSNKTNFHW
jgi:hypothetical protein